LPSHTLAAPKHRIQGSGAYLQSCTENLPLVRYYW
jgi:hypothetical protein